MTPRILILPATLALGLGVVAISPPAGATCPLNVVEAPRRTFTLVSFTVVTPDTGTAEPSAEEEGWLESFEQSADDAFGSPGVLHATAFGPLDIALGYPVGAAGGAP